VNRGSRLLLGLFVGATLGVGCFQIALIGPARAADFAAGLGFNIWTLTAGWLLFELLRRAPHTLRFLSLLSVPTLLAASGLVLAHAFFFDVAIERRLTAFDMTAAGVRYFFTTVLPASGLAALLGLWTLSALSALLFSRLPLRVPSRAALLGTALALLATAPLVTRAQRVASPLYDTALELWEVAVRPRVKPSGAVEPRYLAALDKMERTRGVEPVNFSKVIVLVMETMTATNFARESRALPAGTFLRREAQHLHGFDRYFPNNQDSRTGMLDMLFARLVPYEAYSDHGYEHYRHLAHQPSLVDRMRELSYRSAFAVSQTALEDVVGELSWDQTLRLTNSQIARARAAGSLCFTPDEYEQSCEDLVLLPAVVDFVASHERAFVYQEFIWGHAAEYNEASGKSNAAYYSQYVDALLRALSERGLAEQTLLAITSDHGFRDKGRQHELEVYRVPLLFHAAQFAARRDARLLSHVDFGMLLLEELTPRAARVESNPLLMIIGPTGQGNLFAVNEQGGSMLLRNKLGATMMIARHGEWQLAPESVLAIFEQYRGNFDARSRARRAEGLPSSAPRLMVLDGVVQLGLR
jgi:hypothetical protein